MTDRPERHIRVQDLTLAAASVLLGAGVAASYAAYRAVSLTGAAADERLREFGGEMLWPGALIVVAVAAMVWFGWKLNID